MKKSTEKLLLGGALVSLAVALFAKSAGAAPSSSVQPFASTEPPANWHPEVTNPAERSFIWNEVQTKTAAQIAASMPAYIQRGLSDLAIAALADEAERKATTVPR